MADILAARPELEGRTLEEVFLGIVGADGSGD
jgi:hypothetical protein